MALSADSICSGGTALSDLNLVSGVRITDHPTPIIENLIAWTSEKIDSCNVDLAAVNELRYLLRICQEELDGRDDARTGEVIKACHSSSLAEYKVSKEVGLNSATAHGGSPKKSEGKTNAAFSEQLSSPTLGKSRRSVDNARQLQSKSCISATKSRIPSKARPSVRFLKKDSQTLLNRKQDFGLTGSSSRISKRSAYDCRHHSRNSIFNKVPQQKNAYDSGLFVLYFMQRFLEDAPQRLRLQDLSMFGKKWFLPEEASSLRDKIRDTLESEFGKKYVVLSDSSDDDIGDI